MKQWVIKFQPEATNDIDNIGDLIFENSLNIKISDIYCDRIRSFCKKLEYLPSRGRLRPEFGENIRSLVFEGRVTVFYAIEDISVVIIRIFYAGAAIGKVDFGSEIRKA